MAYDRRNDGVSSYIKEEAKNDSNDIPATYDDQTHLVDLFTNESELRDDNNEHISEAMLQG